MDRKYEVWTLGQLSTALQVNGLLYTVMVRAKGPTLASVFLPGQHPEEGSLGSGATLQDATVGALRGAERAGLLKYETELERELAQLGLVSGHPHASVKP